jgi:hypothetical protein
LAVVLASGCSGGPPATSGGSGSVGGADLALLRVSIERPGERPVGPLRLALRSVADDGAFELRASDPLGRGLWTLRVVGERALWLDVRERRACSVPAGRGLRIFGWPDLPWPMVPKVLRGEPPVVGSTVDDAGRVWKVEVDGPRAATRWSFSSSPEPGAAALSFERRDGEMVLRAEPRSVALRWRLVTRERAVLAEPITLGVPAGYAEGGCDALELP